MQTRILLLLAMVICLVSCLKGHMQVNEVHKDTVMSSAKKQLLEQKHYKATRFCYGTREDPDAEFDWHDWQECDETVHLDLNGGVMVIEPETDVIYAITKQHDWRNEGGGIKSKEMTLLQLDAGSTLCCAKYLLFPDGEVQFYLEYDKYAMIYSCNNNTRQ